jgi:hypothetical protein
MSRSNNNVRNDGVMADDTSSAMTMTTSSAVGPRDDSGNDNTAANTPSSSSTAALATIPTTGGGGEGGTTVKKILQKRWICDVCKVKWFLSYQEACKHEENCAAIGNAATATVATTTTIDDGSNTSINSRDISADDHSVPISDIDDEISKMSDSAAPASPRKKKSYKRSRDDVHTTSSTAAAAADATNKKMKSHGEKENNKRRGQHHDDDKTTKKNSNKEGSGTGGGLASIFLPKTTTTPMKKNDSTKKTMTMDTTIIPGVSRAEYEEHIVAEKAVAATAAAARQKQQPKLRRATTKRLATLTEESDDDDDDNEEEEEVVVGGEESKQSKNVFKRTRRLQKHDHDDDVEYVATTKSTTIDTNAKNSTKNNNKKKQKTLLSKKEMAEHQAAEMFAKRKQVAIEERSRQKKREEIRRQLLRPTKPCGGSESVMMDVNETATMMNNDINIFSSVAVTTSTDSEMIGSISSNSLTLLHTIPIPKKDIVTVIFPCPSHVITNGNSTDDYNKFDDNSSSYVCRRIRDIPRYQHLKPNLLPSTSTDELDCSSQRSPGLFTGNNDANEMTNTMYNMLSSVFDPSNTNNMTSTSKQQSDEDRNQLWVDRYSTTVIPDDVLGTNNKDVSKKLLSFIEEWKLRRHKSVQRMGLKSKNKNGHKKKKKKKSGYDSDDSFLDDGDAGLETIFVLTGPTGSGKTRLVHAISEQCDCNVIEINTSEQRSGTALKRAIQETTQSHSSLAKTKKKQGNKGVGGLFGGMITCADNENDEQGMEIYDDSASYYDSDEEESVKEESSQSLTIILIDEVDLLFDDDTGFWLALSQVSQKAKCPIVVTANAIPPEMTNFRFQYNSLTYPPKQDCAIKMAHVAKLQDMHFIHNLTPDEISVRLALIAEVCHCDMRKVLNEMQLFHFADSRRQPSMTKYDIHNFGLWPTPTTTTMEFSFPSCRVEDRPLILEIEPKIIPRGKHTLITITGKNFSSTATLVIGRKLCSNYRIISPTEIIAICPPCMLPTGVSEKLIYQDDYKKHIDCMTCKYLEVVVRKKCANGILLDSSSLLGIDSVTPNWNIEYDIPLRDDFGKENASKEDFIRKWKARSERQKKTAIRNDVLLSSDEEEEFENERITQSSTLVDHNNEERDESTLENECEMEDIDPQTMLDTAIAGMDIFEASPNTLSCSSSHESLQEVDRLVDELCLLSDAALLEDSLSTLAIPPLAGPVEGFGSDALSSKDSSSLTKITKGKNKKPPSFEMLYSSGMNDSGFFFGSTDSYVTHPIMKRDRQLLSYSELYSRGLGFLDSSHGISIEENPDNSRSGVEDDETESSFFLQSRSEDDILLNPHASPTISSLPSLLKQGLDVARSHGFVINRMPMLQSRRSQIATKALGVGHSAIANCDLWYTGLRHDDSDEATRKVHVWQREPILDYPLSLDYLPYLRAIAHHENRINGTVNDMMKDDGNLGESLRSSRRTRTSRKQIRRHYLDECTGGQDKSIEDKARELANQYMIVE